MENVFVYLLENRATIADMRLRIVTILALAAVLVGGLACFAPRNIVSYFACADEYIVYCRMTDLPCLDNGLGKEVHSGGDIEETLARCDCVDGVTVRLPVGTDVETIVARLAVNVCSSQKIANVYVFCGYSPLVKGGITVDGQRINVQIAVTEYGVFVGSPLLLGSY